MQDTPSTELNHIGIAPSFELVAQLRDRLSQRAPSPASPEMALLEKLVTQLAARYARDKDPVLSLSIVATVGLAAKAGNKAAKNVVFDHRRWHQSPPPPLTILPSEDEQIAALKTLATKSGQWLTEYALRAAIDPEISKSVRSQARKVCAKSADGPGELLDIASQLAAEGSPIDLLGSVALVVPDLAKGRVTGFVDALEKLTNAVNARLVASHTPVSDAEIGAAHNHLMTILECLAKVDPGALIEPPAIRVIVAIDQLRAGISIGACRRLRDVLATVWSVARPVVSAPAEELVASTASRLRWMAATIPLLEAAQATRPEEDAARALKEAAASAAPRSDEGIPHALVDAIADLVRVLPADAPPTLDVDAIDELRARIESCARLAGVELIGTTGQILPFDPVTQFLDADDSVAPMRVRVAKPGIGARRINGSLRIIRKPIVQLMED